MVLCDTNIFINALNGKQETLDELEKIGFNNVILSAITIMELYQGMSSKAELTRMKKQIQFSDVVHLDKSISSLALNLIEKLNLSQGLLIPDAIIGASVVTNNI